LASKLNTKDKEYKDEYQKIASSDEETNNEYDSNGEDESNELEENLNHKSSKLKTKLNVLKVSTYLYHSSQ
jgi:hypothetical protein